MSRLLSAAVAALLLLAARLPAADDDLAKKVAEQKKAAEENLAQLKVESGAYVLVETDHLLIYAMKAYESRMKDGKWGSLLEKCHATAKKALKYEDKEDPWAGKLTVYLLTDREQFTSFVRRIEKRRLEPGETGSFQAHNDPAHAASAPGETKAEATVEVSAGEQIAAAFLAKKAGKDVVVPGWLVSGFGRATVWRSMPAVAGRERAESARLARGGRKTGKHIWTEQLDANEAPVLRGSLSDYLAYGPGAGKFLALLEGFRPEENGQAKTFDDACKAASIGLDTLDRAWLRWLPGK